MCSARIHQCSSLSKVSTRNILCRPLVTDGGNGLLHMMVIFLLMRLLFHLQATDKAIDDGRANCFHVRRVVYLLLSMPPGRQRRGEQRLFCPSNHIWAKVAMRDRDLCRCDFTLAFSSPSPFPMPKFLYAAHRIGGCETAASILHFTSGSISPKLFIGA